MELCVYYELQNHYSVGIGTDSLLFFLASGRR